MTDRDEWPVIGEVDYKSLELAHFYMKLEFCKCLTDHTGDFFKVCEIIEAFHVIFLLSKKCHIWDVKLNNYFKGTRSNMSPCLLKELKALLSLGIITFPSPEIKIINHAIECIVSSSSKTAIN